MESLLQFGRLVLVVFAGSVVAWAAFNATAPGHLLTYSSPPCRMVQDFGFDPWTGQPHGRTFNCQGRIEAVDGVPDEWAGRWAIPLPLGFVAGSLVMAGVLLLIDRCRVWGGRRGQAGPRT